MANRQGEGPTTVRRRLRAELRNLRLRRKLSIDDVVSDVEWSSSKLIRIESGQVGVSVSDLVALLSIYGVQDAEQVEELKRLARASRQRTWWSKYQRYIPPSYLEFIGAESDAVQMHHYHPTIVPGLLQTRGYATAINDATALADMSAEVASARVEIRMLRQQEVLGREDPPTYVGLLDEAVLRRPVGDPAVMREQMDQLIALAKRDSVSIVVVPFAAGPHPGLTGAFALMEYGGDRTEDVLCLETATGNFVLRESPETIAQYRVFLQRILSLGLHGSAALEFIADVRDALG